MSTTRTAIRSTGALATLALIASAGLAGCSSSSTDPTAIRWNATPELQTRTQRWVDVDNMVHETWNANNRAAWDDFFRAAMLDRPSRTTGLPSLY